jgi:WD40 repeat protein
MKTSKSKKRTSVEQVEPRATLLQKPSTIVGLAWLSLSKAVAASQDGNMHFFDPMSGQTFPTISTSRAMSSMSLLGSSKVVTGHPDGRIIFWDLKKDGQALSMEALNSCRSHGRMIARLAAQPGSESLIASASLDGCIKLFDRRASHFAVQSISLPTSERALVVAWIDESKFLSGASDGVVRVHTMKLA